MPHSLSEIYVHLVFHVHPASIRIKEEHEERLHHYLGGVLHTLHCRSIIVGGMPDHVHLLFDLTRDKSISEVVQTLKTSSHHLLSELDSAYRHFQWQKGYGVFSVSASVKAHVRNYIAHQRQHHRHKTMQEEYEEMLAMLGIDYDPRYLWEKPSEAP